jgi:predicted HAD superfamily phosphohydrolase YqeG
MKISEAQFFHELSARSFGDAVIIIDIDGTLACSSSLDVDARARTVIRELQERNTVYAFSNNYNGSRSRHIARALQLPYIEAPHKKPNKKILHYIDIGTSPVIAIGDKFLTDGLFAYFIKAEYIRVKRYRCDGDTALDRLACMVDDCVYGIACTLGLVKRCEYKRDDN